MRKVYAAAAVVVLAFVALIGWVAYTATQNTPQPKITHSWCDKSTRILVFNTGDVAATFDPYECPTTATSGFAG